MQKKINLIVKSAKEDIKNVTSINDLNNIKSKYLGKNSEFNGILRSIKDLPQEERPKVGLYINKGKEDIQKIIDEKTSELEIIKINAAIEKEKIDITLDLPSTKVGSLHPCSLVINEILDIFIGMGFSIKDGPEIETDYFNFQALNIPKDHPARDMQDTFYLGNDLLLRSQTSPVQVRTMLEMEPPIRIVTPGKVYRADSDATHSPMFQQMEGLVVDENISLCDLYGTLTEFAKRLFDKDTKTRFRPSFFPFTEPSVEVDVSCAICHGKGCNLCKGTGWLEILGAGVVNPKVLENAGIDSSKYSGFAFGLGIERIAMIKYAIPDMRILFENDIRFLSQFTKEI